MSVDPEALRVLLEHAKDVCWGAWAQRDQEFCVGIAEYEESEREFEELWAPIFEAIAGS